MIQMLINLGKWLENRFPKQFVVLEKDYLELHNKIQKLETAFELVAKLEYKVSDIERNAVHKEPVQELIKAMTQMKAEIVSLRAGLGITASAATPESLEMMLNGEFIKQGANNG